MTKRMLIDSTHPEETRVAVVSGSRLEEYDYETLVRKQLKSNIYLVKVTRVEPSLQAAFVDFGGNRHGFLPFPEIHTDYYRIPIADREALLAEERAIAEEQARKEEEEDEAELAELKAKGENLDEETAEEAEEAGHVEEVIADEEGEEGETEAYVPRHTGSIAEEIAQETVSDETEEDTTAEEPVGEAEEQPAEKSAEAHGGEVTEAAAFRSSIRRRYKIQEVIKRNQIMLIQISKEERGNKGAAVTSYISLPGRYCVLMPNSPRGGGVSRKVSNAKDRHRLKKILAELGVPEGMSVILRTAGVSRSLPEIKRDLEYLLRLWDEIRELTLKSTAPALIYEEGNLIKRAIRDLYRRDIDEVHVAGEEGYRAAHDFMKTLMPSHAEKVQLYKDETVPLFHRYQVERQIDEIHEPTVHLKSGGYIVINPTEALVSIDVNSGRATKGRHIEETALKTNIEAAEEIARQLRLRDLGGLVVIDFIDMEDRRGNRTVEKRLNAAMAHDRARIQLGRISAFGLLELSRQRLNPSLVETNFEACKHCKGIGVVRTVETTAVMILRAIEEEGMKVRGGEVRVAVPSEIALYIFNNKRQMLSELERRHGVRAFINADDTLLKPAYAISSSRAGAGQQAKPQRLAPVQSVDISDLPEISAEDLTNDMTVAEEENGSAADGSDQPRQHQHRRHHGGERRPHDAEGGGDGRRRGRRGGRRRGGRGRNRGEGHHNHPRHHGGNDSSGSEGSAPPPSPAHDSGTAPPAAANQSHHSHDDAPAENSAGGGNRKGWWKRLTE